VQNPPPNIPRESANYKKRCRRRRIPPAEEAQGLCVVLHTSGGDPDAAYHLGIRLQDFAKERLVFIVPRYAKSAGTLLACAGDEIYLTPISELGPVDPQIYVEETGRWISAKAAVESLRQVIGVLKAFPDISPRAVEAIISRLPIVELSHYDSLLGHMESLLTDLLSRRMLRDKPEETRKIIAEKLVKGYKYHGKVVHTQEAQQLGLKIRLLDGEELKAVYNLYRLVKDMHDSYDRELRLIPDLWLETKKHEVSKGLIYLPEPAFEQVETHS